MWEAPRRGGDGAGGGTSGGDALSDAPDDSRPRNPWPRLIAFALTVLVCMFLLGLCVATFANPPRRELRIEVETLAVGVPRFFPVTTFGADRDGFTYGAWVTLLPANRWVALLSLGPASRCNLKWEPTVQAGGQTGVFVDRCGSARFDAEGAVLAASAPRDLDAFPTRRAGTAIYVDVTSVTLGGCRDGAAGPCSRAGLVEQRKVPREALPPDFGRK